MNNVFGLDIGTRNVVGTVGYQTDDRERTSLKNRQDSHLKRCV